MKIIGLIPARGGSKGIPRKNLSPFLDTTLLGHKINQARMSICDEIWVSTEDLEIKTESLNYGAQVIDRPDFLSQDKSSTDSMLVHAVEYLNCDLNDVVVLMQITSPLIKVESIDLMIRKLISNPELNSVIAVRETHPFMWMTKDDTNWEPVGHSRKWRPRRQDLDRGGWETGGCYAAKVSAIRKEGVRYPLPTGTVSLSYVESIDIDTPMDLEEAKNLSI